MDSFLPPPKQIRLLNKLLNETIYPTLKEICQPDMSDFEEDDDKDEFNSDYEEIWEHRETLLFSRCIDYLKNNLY